MLDSLRGFAKSWPGKILGGFLLVGVAGFGINNVILDLGSNTVARVGDEEISSREFVRAYQNLVNRVAQQSGTVPTPEEAMAMGLPGFVLENLAVDAALVQMARGFGIGVSDEKLSELVRQDVSFQGALGTFDRARFDQVLRGRGETEAEYFEAQTDVARREQLELALFGDVRATETAAALIGGYESDQRSIEYFVLNETNIDTPAEPTEEELAAYLSEHQSEFRTVETRQVQMLRLSPQELAQTITVDDAAIAAEYERTSESLTRPERRTIEQVVLNAEQVAAFEAGQAAGTPFAQLVADAGLTPTAVGTLAQAEITDPTLAQAAFGLAEGDFAIVGGAAGQRAVHVSAIEAGGTPTLEEAREQIASNLALVEARNEIAEVQDQVEELRAAFRPLTEIAERFGLDLYEANVTAGGTELDVLPGLAAEDRTRVSQAIFKAEQGSLTAALPLAGNANLYFDLVAVEPARDQTLDEVRDVVIAALTAERSNNALLAALDDAVARLDAGEALADVAASYGLFPQISAPFTRFGGEDANVDGTVASAVFAGGPDHQGSAVSQSGEFMVFDVVDATASEAPVADATLAELESQAQLGLYYDFATAVRNDVGLRTNQQALTQALTPTSSGL